jgi:flavodoxin I
MSVSWYHLSMLHLCCYKFEPNRLSSMKRIWGSSVESGLVVFGSVSSTFFRGKFSYLRTTLRAWRGGNTLKILVLYYSRTGNTEKMARAVAEGAKSVQGAEVELSYSVSPEELNGYDAILVGAATYHHDMSVGFKSFFEEVAVKNISLKGKIGAAFGSYGWSGEAPKLVIEIMKNKFEMDVTEPPISIRYEPDEAGLEKCKELGKRIAERLIHAA